MAGGFRVYGQENPKSPNEELNITNFGSLNVARLEGIYGKHNLAWFKRPGIIIDEA